MSRRTVHQSHLCIQYFISNFHALQITTAQPASIDLNITPMSFCFKSSSIVVFNCNIVKTISCSATNSCCKTKRHIFKGAIVVPLCCNTGTWPKAAVLEAYTVSIKDMVIIYLDMVIICL